MWGLVSCGHRRKAIGQPIVVLNKAGAGGQVGWTELAKQKPDGYYLGYISMPHMLSAVLDPERKSTFKAEDITPIISQALDPTTISVRPDSPWKTIKELVDDAKKRPGQITAGIVGYLQDDEIGYLQFAEGGWGAAAIGLFRRGRSGDHRPSRQTCGCALLHGRRQL